MNLPSTQRYITECRWSERTQVVEDKNCLGISLISVRYSLYLGHQ